MAKLKKKQTADNSFYCKFQLADLTLPIEIRVSDEGNIWFDVSKSTSKKQELFDILNEVFADNEKLVKDNSLMLEDLTMRIYNFTPSDEVRATPKVKVKSIN